MNDKLCKIILVLLLCMNFITAQNITDVNNLSAKLLDGYNVNTRPITNQNDILNITLTLFFLRIRSFEEVEGRLTTVLRLILEWQDDSMKWQPAEHNNIRSIRFPESSVWTPEITVINSLGQKPEIGDHIRGKVEYTNDGVAVWQNVEEFETICNLNTTYYPYDIQQCDIDVKFTTYTPSELRPNASILVKTYEEHKTWSLLEVSIECLEYLICRSQIKVERQPQFMIINLFIPMVTLAVLNPMVFFLPQESGERIGFAVTDLLALTVFMTILGDYLPQNSDPIPMMSYMLLLLFGQSALILTLVIFGLRIYHRSEVVPIPTLYQNLVTFFNSKFMHCSWHRRVEPIDDEKARNEIDNELIHVTEIEKFESKFADNKEAVSIEEQEVGNRDKNSRNLEIGRDTTWKDVSFLFDMVCVYTMYLADVVIVLTFLLYMRINSKYTTDLE